MITRPSPSDLAPSFQHYVGLVPDGDVLAGLEQQATAMQSLLANASEERGNHAYAEGKWTIKRLVLHIADAERMFCYRAMCVARGDRQELPQFEENAYAELDGSDARSLASILTEYSAVRAASVCLFRGFDDEAWQRRGTANGYPVAVHAMPWIVLGHDLHHVSVLRERYGL